MVQGNGYIGSSSLQTSTANQEVIPSPPAGWTFGYFCYKFSFMNDQDCHVKINGGDQIFLRAGQGWQMDQNDKPISSFIIVDSTITFNWFGAY
jgi:hypothetical protein